MNDDGQKRYEAGLRAYLKAEVTRAQMLKAAGIGLAAAALPGVAAAADSSPGRIEFPFYPKVAGTYSAESIQDILNTLQTFEHFVITFFSGVLSNADKLGFNALLRAVVQAVLAQEQYHADFLASIGARTLTDTFTLADPTPLTNLGAFLKTMELGETMGTAAYMTAAREFAELGQPTLVKYAYQIGATEAEHRVLARATLALNGDTTSIPPNNKAFETDLFLYIRDVYSLFKQFGFIGGTGTVVTYPGREAALTLAGPMAGAVIQKKPNNASSSVTAADNLTAERT